MLESCPLETWKTFTLAQPMTLVTSLDFPVRRREVSFHSKIIVMSQAEQKDLS